MISNVKRFAYLVFLFILITYFPNMWCAESTDASQNLKVDLVIVSYDRPLQLYIALDSIKNISGLGEIYIMYRAIDQDMDNAYKIIKKDFAGIHLIKQDENPQADCRSFPLEVVIKSPNSYIIFATDDIAIKEHIDLNACVSYLENTHSYGFFFKLGKSPSESYSMHQLHHLLPILKMNSNTYGWCLNQLENDWRYSHLVDMVLYRKKDIQSMIPEISYVEPLKDHISLESKKNINRSDLCNLWTKIINFPYLLSAQKSDAPQNVKADLVIFSYNRPLQLYALLESFKHYVSGLGEIYIIYRVHDEEIKKVEVDFPEIHLIMQDENVCEVADLFQSIEKESVIQPDADQRKNFENAYKIIEKDFPNVHLIKQGENPHADFKALTLKATFDSPNPYIIFAVDDIIIKDAVDIAECITYLEKYEAYGFFLRMGKNLTACYSMNRSQSLPPLLKVGDNLYGWCFKQGEHDWGYPHTVDMTIYRKKDIHYMLANLPYSAPNTLEGNWAAQAQGIMQRFGLCYELSKVVNVPLNVVQNELQPNRSMKFLSAEQLLDIFYEGKKIDINPLNNIHNTAAHMSYIPTFTERK